MCFSARHKRLAYRYYVKANRTCCMEIALAVCKLQIDRYNILLDFETNEAQGKIKSVNVWRCFTV